VLTRFAVVRRVLVGALPSVELVRDRLATFVPVAPTCGSRMNAPRNWRSTTTVYEAEIHQMARAARISASPPTQPTISPSLNLGRQ
jgi:hypothetical protein